MKTKLSFLALPSLCLGIVLTFVLAACSSDSSSGSGNEPGTSSNSGGGEKPPSSAVQGKLVISNLGVERRNSNSPIFDVIGIVEGSTSAKVLKVEFHLDKASSNWIYDSDKQPVNSAINIDAPGALSFPLSNYYIDLSSKDFGSYCGPLKFWVKACADDKCAVDPTTSNTVEFQRDQSFCNPSSSSQTVQSSSSEAKRWKFGTATEVEISGLDEWITISGTSLSFALLESDGQPDLEVKGGAGLRKANTLCGADDIEPGTYYDVKDSKSGLECLGDAVGTKNKISLASPDDPSVSEGDYIFIYSGNNIYLLHFQKGADRWRMWPKKCTYWKALENP